MKCDKLIILGILSCAFLCGCQKGDEIPIETVMPFDFINTTLSAEEQIAVEYVNSIIDGDYASAFEKVYVPDDCFITVEQFEEVEDKVSELYSNAVILDIDSTSKSVSIEFGNKICEDFGKAKKGEEAPYLGDSIQGRTTLDFEISNEGVNPYMITLDKDFVTSEVYYLSIPDGCDLWLGGKLLNDAERDNDGYYKLTNFVDVEVLNLTADCDVEQGKTINLNLGAEVGEIIVDNASLAPTNTHNGCKAWQYVWETDRVTNDEAAAWIKDGFQEIFNSIILREDFNRNTFEDVVMSEKANLEQIKVGYMKCMDTFTPTKSVVYMDLMCVDFIPLTVDERERKQVVFEVIDRNTMTMQGTLKYSYIKYNYASDDSSIRSGEVRGNITLTKDDGEWKFLSFDEKFLRSVV